VRSASASEIGSESDYLSLMNTEDERSTPRGAERIVQPLYNAAYAALRPGRYDDRYRRRMASTLRINTARATLREAIAEEDEKMLKESIRPRYATEPGKISRAIITGREMDARAFEAAKKSLKREFPNRFNM
jgi:hypothetical protein